MKINTLLRGTYPKVEGQVVSNRKGAILIIVDGTIENSSELIYLPLLLVEGVYGLTTFQIESLCRISQKKVLQAVGQLQIKPTRLRGSSTRRLKQAKLVPVLSIRPKFWTVEQVTTIVEQTGNSLAIKRIKWLKSFVQDSIPPEPVEVGTPERVALVLTRRESQKKAEEPELRRNGYLSSEIMRVYPGIQNLIREYSNEMREAGRDQWCLEFRPMNVVLTHMLSQRFGITTACKVDTGSKYGRAKLFDKRVIDKFMADQGMLKLELPDEQLREMATHKDEFVRYRSFDYWEDRSVYNPIRPKH